MSMTFQSYVLILVVGAALIALWLETRFRERSPQAIGMTIVHVLVSNVLLALSPVGMKLVIAGGDEPSRQMFAVFFVLLPAFVYAFVAILWLMRWSSSMMTRFR